MTLTAEEEQLALTLNFDENVLRLVKSELQKPLEPFAQAKNRVSGKNIVLSGAQISAEILSGKGLVVELAETFVGRWKPDFIVFIHQMRSLLLPYGYMAFLKEWLYPHPCLAVLKTLDQNDIIRAVETRGWDFDNNFWQAEKLIAKLEEWRNLCDFNIIGADYNNIKLEFRTLPENLVSFADNVNYLCWELQEIYDVNPYIGDELENQKVAQQLAQIIRETHRLCLWWD